ncbi:MAG: PDZ domain-containing protein [Gammaproteobacteria bacterium]
MNRALIPYVALLVGGIAIGAVARGVLNDEPATRPVQSDTRLPDLQRLPEPTNDQEATIIGMIESLSLALTQESEYRLVLEEQIDGLNDRVDALTDQLDKKPPAAATERAVKDRLVSRQRRGGPLTVEKLTSAGLDERTARTMKSKVDDLAMQRLYLRDQAMREGWLGDARYREESQRLFTAQNGLRDEFGDDAYEGYLYASGRPNRVQVQNVLDNSPAFEAGLRSGDQILSYAGERTFASNELRSATQQGTAGEMIPVQIVRDGQTLDLYVPRGPLGIQMTGTSERPGG